MPPESRITEELQLLARLFARRYLHEQDDPKCFVEAHDGKPPLGGDEVFRVPGTDQPRRNRVTPKKLKVTGST